MSNQKSGRGKKKSNWGSWLEEEAELEDEDSSVLSYQSPKAQAHQRKTNTISPAQGHTHTPDSDKGTTGSAGSKTKSPSQRPTQQQQPSFVYATSIPALWKWDGGQYQRVCEGPVGCVILDNKKQFAIVLYDSSRKTQATIPLSPKLLVKVLSQSHVSFAYDDKCYTVHCHEITQLLNLLRSIIFSNALFVKFCTLKMLSQITSSTIRDEADRSNCVRNLSITADIHSNDASLATISNDSYTSMEITFYSVPTENLSNLDKKLGDIELMTLKHRGLQNLCHANCSANGHIRRILDWIDGLHEGAFHWRVVDSPIIEALRTECETGEIKEISQSSNQWTVMEIHVKHVRVPANRVSKEADAPLESTTATETSVENSAKKEDVRVDVSSSVTTEAATGASHTETEAEEDAERSRSGSKEEIVQRMARLGRAAGGGVTPNFFAKGVTSSDTKTAEKETTGETVEPTVVASADHSAPGVSERNDTDNHASHNNDESQRTVKASSRDNVPVRTSQAGSTNVGTKSSAVSDAGSSGIGDTASFGNGSAQEARIVVRDDSDEDIPTVKAKQQSNTFDREHFASYGGPSVNTFGSGMLERILMDTGRLMNSMSQIEAKLDAVHYRKPKFLKESTQQENQEDESSFEHIKALVARMGQAVEECEEKTKSNGKNNEALEEEIQMLHEQLEHARSDRSSLQRRVSSFQTELRETRKTLDSVREQLDQSEEDNSRLRERLSSAKSRQGAPNSPNSRESASLDNSHVITDAEEVADPKSFEKDTFVRGDVVAALLSESASKEDLDKITAEKDAVQRELDELKSSMNQQIKQIKSQYRKEAKEAIRRAQEDIAGTSSSG